MALFSVKGDMGKAVERWREIAGPGLKDDVLAAAEDTAQYYVRKMRQNAHKVGKDWGKAADAAVIQKHADNVTVALPQEAFNYEYGTEALPPRPVLRQTTTQMDRFLKGYFNKQLRLRLFGKGEL